jgi:catechol 2,3-dioxygenase-like lactoylglutathione lyase family enzyme
MKPETQMPRRKERGARPQPLIAASDVPASSRWYAELLGLTHLPPHDHRRFYDRIYDGGELVLQLHAWDEERHPNLMDAHSAPVGHGVLLWFEMSDFDAAVRRARDLGAEIIEEPHFNPAPKHREVWLRDPDGYVIVLSSPDGERSPASRGGKE